jgi:uncharacterized membrane protein AbrB (regulator of aidB expression)
MRALPPLYLCTSALAIGRRLGPSINHLVLTMQKHTILKPLIPFLLLFLLTLGCGGLLDRSTPTPPPPPTFTPTPVPTPVVEVVAGEGVGEPIASMEVLQLLLENQYRVGDEVAVSILRNGDAQEIVVELTEEPRS